MQKRWAGALGLSLWCASAMAQERSLTCDRREIDAHSYRLVTQAQALNVLRPRHDWWDSFELGKYEDDLLDLNLGATRAAQRALEIDPRNLMAHGILARQFVILDEPELAEAAWRRVFEGGGAVAWTATLYDVDARSYFFMVFDARSIRIYRFGEITKRFTQGFYGIPNFPGPEDERFWAAGGGCVDPSFVPEAVVPWSDVREIKAGNWVLWFKLTRPITVSSDRGKRKELREIKVNLHGRTGTLEVYKPVGEEKLAMRGIGPAGYQDLVRRTLVKFVDPERRIALPPLKPGLGW